MLRFRYPLEWKVVTLAVLVVAVSAVAHYLTLFTWGEDMTHVAHCLLIFLLIIGSTIVSLILSRMLVRQLNTIRDAALRLARGQQVDDLQVDDAGADQVDDLAAAFNTLSAVIREQVERYRAVMNMAGDGVITVYRESDGAIIRSINRTAELMFGITYDDLPSKRVKNVIGQFFAAPDDVTRMEQFVIALRPNSDPAKIDVTARRKDGTTFPIQISGGVAVVAVRDDIEDEFREVPLVTLILVDMTEVKNQEQHLKEAVEARTLELKRTIEDLKKANDSLELARKAINMAMTAQENAMTAQENFMANLNHDLRTPLTVVLGYAEQLLEETQEEGETKYEKDLRRIVVSGKDLKDLIEDSSNYFKFRRNQQLSVNFQQFSVRKLIADHRQSIEYLAGKNENVFRAEGFDQVDEITADRYFLWRVLVNLISNACKYTTRGEITLSIGPDEEPGWVAIQIRDTGTGIPATTRQRLFERDVVINEDPELRERRGIGIGLSICKLYCGLMGGTVQLARSETDGPDHGSTFQVRLPSTVHPGAGGPPRPVPPLASATARDRRVLIIEDDKEVRSLLRRHLDNLGYESAVAADGLEGLRQARAINPSAIILDVKLPDFNGWAVLAALKYTPETAGIPVVLLTVVDNLQKGYALYAHEYLLKPFTKEAITDALRRVLPGPTQARARVLVVAPPEVTREIREALGPLAEQLELAIATGYDSARTALAEGRLDAIILDPRLPDRHELDNSVEGAAALTWITEAAEAASIPTIFVNHTEWPQPRETYHRDLDTVIQNSFVDRKTLLDRISAVVCKVTAPATTPVLTGVRT